VFCAFDFTSRNIFASILLAVEWYSVMWVWTTEGCVDFDWSCMDVGKIWPMHWHI